MQLIFNESSEKYVGIDDLFLNQAWECTISFCTSTCIMNYNSSFLRHDLSLLLAANQSMD